MKFDHKVFRFWREQRRMTLEECAKAVGASKASVSRGNWKKTKTETR